MRYRLLFTWTVFALLAPAAAAAAAQAPRDYGLAAAVEALVTVGARYHYGGSSPDTGFDCSGLVAHVYESAWGRELQPGDLVFYNTRNRPFSHVGIYLGHGDFVHAPRRGQRARFSGARRLDPPAD